VAACGTVRQRLVQGEQSDEIYRIRISGNCDRRMPDRAHALSQGRLPGVIPNRSGGETAQFEDRDPIGDPIIAAQFNTISPENALKWQSIHPSPDTYNFDQADQYVAFGEKHKMFIVGHCLVWHSQTPRWVFEDAQGKPLTRDALLERMHDHIKTVVGRYKGRINGWDVVNEALNEDGTMRQSPWYRIIGDDFIVKAFQFAHEADPNAQLYYNDYSLENEAKRKGAVELMRKLKAAGVPITGIGLQGHVRIDGPDAKTGSGDDRGVCGVGSSGEYQRAGC
jgi:endo-1,4-beta-xylanase